MKILYITPGDHVDYQDDCLLIGLKEIFGSDVVDVNKKEHIYTSYQGDTTKLYGRGFTVTKVIPEDNTDRTDIQSKIKNKYFNYVIYGSIWRSSSDINKILEYYPRNKVIAVDGEDETNLHSTYSLGIPYFKRELDIKNARGLYPIRFSFPTSKLKTDSLKTKLLADITPLDRKTYIYNTEEEYYQDYRDSHFAITCKKAGWDCMRHWEILGNGCIPIFIDIDKCPKNTINWVYKDLCCDLIKELDIKNYSDKKHIIDCIRNKIDKSLYDMYYEAMCKYGKFSITTEEVANKFIEKLEDIQNYE